MTDDDNINSDARLFIFLASLLVGLFVLPLRWVPTALFVLLGIAVLWLLLAWLVAKLGERHQQQSKPGVSPEPVDLPPPTIDRVERETKEIQS